MKMTTICIKFTWWLLPIFLSRFSYSTVKQKKTMITQCRAKSCFTHARGQSRSVSCQMMSWFLILLISLSLTIIQYRALISNYIDVKLRDLHDDVIKWKHFPRNWPFVREIHRSPVNFPHKGQWRGALMFSLIYAWINDWVNNREAGDLRRQHGHYDVIVM